MTPDVNVLVAASRADHPHHDEARAWFEQALESATPTVTLLPLVVASFLRLVTSARIFARPTPIEQAVAFVDALIGAGANVAAIGAEWPRLRQLCLDKQLHGNDLPDAWLAAAVQQLGEHLVTFDKGFRKLLRRGELTLLPAA
jgi:uncharacterized protein